MGSALALNSGRAVGFNRASINHDMVQGWLARNDRTGGRTFQGEQFTFNGKTGQYTLGFGDKAKKLGDEVEVVVNHVYTVAAWQCWPDKGAPSYPAIVMPFQTGKDLPELTETQNAMSKPGYKGKGEVPVFKDVLVLILRNLKGDKLYHWICAGTAKGSAMRFLADAFAQGKKHGTDLPVVTLTSYSVEGKDGDFMSAVFDITGWTKALPVDDPDDVMTQDADGQNDDDTAVDAEPVTIKSRAAKVATTEAATAAVEKVKASGPIPRAEVEEAADDTAADEALIEAKTRRRKVTL